jgi:hypothetical protein
MESETTEKKGFDRAAYMRQYMKERYYQQKDLGIPLVSKARVAMDKLKSHNIELFKQLLKELNENV